MSVRKWLVISAFLVAGGTMVFANGTNDDDNYGNGGYGPRGDYHMGGGPRGGMNYSEQDLIDLEGTFTVVDGEYPALKTPEGKIVYLMMRFPVAEVPAEGAALKVQAVKSPMSPDLYMVVGATVDGKELATPWNEDGERRGPEGRGGMMYGGQGGPGARPGWGYSDTPKK